MKKMMFLVLVAWITSFTFTAKGQYTIVYAHGIDTLFVQSTDNIANLIFYEQADEFWRGEAIGDIIPFSSHGYLFYLKDVRIKEDTLNNSITILSGIVVDKPMEMLAVIEPIPADTDPLVMESTLPLWFWLLFGFVACISLLWCYRVWR
jgi:hypothetical protein